METSLTQILSHLTVIIIMFSKRRIHSIYLFIYIREYASYDFSTQTFFTFQGTAKTFTGQSIISIFCMLAMSQNCQTSAVMVSYVIQIDLFRKYNRIISRYAKQQQGLVSAWLGRMSLRLANRVRMTKGIFHFKNFSFFFDIKKTSYNHMCWMFS